MTGLYQRILVFSAMLELYQWLTAYFPAQSSCVVRADFSDCGLGYLAAGTSVCYLTLPAAASAAAASLPLTGTRSLRSDADRHRDGVPGPAQPARQIHSRQVDSKIRVGRSHIWLIEKYVAPAAAGYLLRLHLPGIQVVSATITHLCRWE